MRERASLFIPFKSLTKHNIMSHFSSLTGLSSPREAPNTHYMMLHLGIFPPLTMKVVPQGLNTIKTSCKGVNTSPMWVQQHTMIKYIRISSEVTNTSTLSSAIQGCLPKIVLLRFLRQNSLSHFFLHLYRNTIVSSPPIDLSFISLGKVKTLISLSLKVNKQLDHFNYFPK